jgi:hypothetical protein
MIASEAFSSRQREPENADYLFGQVPAPMNMAVAKYRYAVRIIPAAASWPEQFR